MTVSADGRGEQLQGEHHDDGTEEEADQRLGVVGLVAPGRGEQRDRASELER